MHCPRWASAALSEGNRGPRKPWNSACTWPCSSSGPHLPGHRGPPTGPPAGPLPLPPGPSRLRPETPGRGAAGAVGTAGVGGGSPASPRGRQAPLFLMDSTGLAYRREDTVLRWRRGQKLLAPWGGGVGWAYAPDPRLRAGALLRFRPRGGVLLGDVGFDGREVWGVAARWDGEVYRRRGVVEGVFGAFAEGLFAKGSLLRPCGGPLWSSSPMACGFCSPCFPLRGGTRRFIRQARLQLTLYPPTN